MAHEEYIRHTDGDRVVLFIHGFLGSPEHFKKFIELVPKEYGIYNVLLYGHGGTVKDFSSASMKIWKSQIKEILKELDEKYKEIIIVSHSMGTLFSYSMAIRYPEKIKAMLLLGTPLKIGVKWIAFVNSIKSIFGIISDEDEVGKAYNRAHSVKLNLKLWEYIGWIPRYSELFCEAKTGRNNIQNVNVPCFIFQSKKDELVSFKSVKFIPDKENIHLTVLKNSAHFIYDKEDLKVVLDKFKDII